MATFSSNISGSLSPDETRYWVIDTDSVDAVLVEITASGSPYEVDVLTTGTSYTDGVFARESYDSSLVSPPRTVNDTSTHEYGSEVVRNAVAVEVTNTGSSRIAVSGQINTKSANSDTSPLAFLQGNSGQAPASVRDGQLTTAATANPYTDEDAQDAVGAMADGTLTYDDPAPSFGIATGGVTAAEIAADAVTTTQLNTPFADLKTLVGSPVTVGAALSLADGQKVYLGDGQDMSFRYDPATDGIVFAEESGPTDVAAITSSGDWNITGVLTETTTV